MSGLHDDRGRSFRSWLRFQLSLGCRVVVSEQPDKIFVVGLLFGFQVMDMFESEKKGLGKILARLQPRFLQLHR